MFDIVNRFSHARILVVDDSVFERRLITNALTKAGFKHIETADDGAEALLKTYDFRPDLVLLDLNMPKLDGYSYCENVRNDSLLPRMPILVQTAVEERSARLRALSCGADDYLTKPLDMDELTLRICSHAERYFMMRDLEDMCDYLKMEVNETKRLRELIEKGVMPSSQLRRFERHCDVLEQMTQLPLMLG